jgi:hypothetical protein
VVYFFLQNLLFKTFVDFAFGKLHSASSSTRVIFVAKAIHVLNDKFCWKKLHRVFSGIFVLERGKCHNVHLATLGKMSNCCVSHFGFGKVKELALLY